MSERGKLGFRILPSPSSVDESVLARLQGSASSVAADAMGRFGFMDAGMRPRSGRPLFGPAVTVVARPGDNLMVHKALQLAKPGDVIVVATCGNTTSAVFGELMCRTAMGAGLAGLVVDGAVRDVEAFASLGFPVFSRAVSPGACDKDGPGEINTPVSCGGVVVMAGDLVIGDADGVAIVPRAHAATVAAEVEAIMKREEARTAEIAAGKLFRPDVDELLRKRGVIE